jgi:hypothetical protein
LIRQYLRGPTIEPIGVANTAFFGSTVRATARSIFRDHFTGAASRDPLATPRHLPLWQQALLKDDYFRLYLWLRQMAPFYHSQPPQSKFLRHFLAPAPLQLDDHPYRPFRRCLVFFYQWVLVRMFDQLTFGRYVKVNSAPGTPYHLFAEFASVASRTSRLAFFPGLAFARGVERLCRNLDLWYINDLRLGDSALVRRNHVFRYELVHFVLLTAENLRWFTTGSYFSWFSPRIARYLDFAVLRLDTLAFRLSVIYSKEFFADKNDPFEPFQ